MKSPKIHADPLHRLTKAQLVAEVLRLRKTGGSGEDKEAQPLIRDGGKEVADGGRTGPELMGSLRDNDAHFRTLIENSLQGIIVHRNFRPLFVNDVFARMFGYESPEAFMALETIEGIFLPEDRESLRKRTRTRMAGNVEPRITQIEGIRRDGSRFWVENRNAVIDWEGKPALVAFSLDITQRHGVEAELRAHQRLLETVFDTVPHWMFIKDQNSRYIRVNRAMAEGLGQPAAKFIGKTYSEVVLESIDESLRVSHEADQQVLEENRPADLREIWVLRQDGKHYLQQVAKMPLQDEDGQPIGLVGISEDITARRHHENELQESEERFRNLVEGSIQGVMIRGEESLLFANQALADIFGYDGPEEMLGLKTISHLVDPEEQVVLERFARERFAGLDALTAYTFRGLRKDGRKIWLETTARLVEWDGGSAIQLTIVDISERVEAEQELRDSKALLQTVIDTIPVWLHLKDRDSRFLLINRKMAADIGVTTEEMVNRPHEEAPHGTLEERKIIRANDLRVLESGRLVQAEEEATMTDGSLRINRVYKVPLRNEEGKIVGILGTSEDITDRKRAEEEVRTHRDYLRLVTDNLPVNIAYWDTEERYQLANRTACTWYCRSHEQVIGHTVEEVLGKKAYAIVAEKIASALQGEEVKFEYTLIYPDGEERLMSFTYVPDRGEDGAIRGAFALGLDLSDRRQAEEELRNSQRLLQTVFDSIPHALSVKDRDGRYIMVNQTALDTYDLTLKDYLGRQIQEVHSMMPEGRSRLAKMDQQVYDTGLRVEWLREKVTLINGETQILDLTKLPICDDDGSVQGLVSIAQNVTAAVWAEEALSAQEERLRSIVDHSPSGISLKDLQGRYQLVNKRFREWVGLTNEEISGKTSVELFPDDNSEELLRQDLHVCTIGEVAEFEFDLTLVSGIQRRMISTKFPVFASGGNIVGVGTITTDVTEQRTTEKHLRQAQRLEALGTLAGGIAHDLNNILFPIIGYAEVLLKDSGLDSTTHGFLETISSSAMRAKDLVSQILLFSRSTEGSRDLCMLDPVAKEVTKLIRSTVSAAIQIELYCEPNLPLVLADPSQMHQVFMNLAINAAQAMPQGGTLRLELNTVQLDHHHSYIGRPLSGPHVQIICEDSGVGMDSETLGRIFEPFFSTKGAGLGTGLGLATVYGIVQRHEGGLEVKSVPGEGTRFEIYLPAVESGYESHTAISGEATGGTETILFVDDETTITTFVKMALEEIGYTIIALNDPHEALEVYRERHESIDLVITDQSMPKLNGDRLAVEMRKINSDIPIVLATGNSESFDTRAMRSFGIMDFLYKPLGSEDLVLFIRDVLDRHQAG